MDERLQKFLARCGLASRRACEELIRSGHVQVDGQVITQLGTKVDGDQQVITVDGSRAKISRLVYYALHKPKGVVCTHADPAGRIRAVDLVPRRPGGISPVGRLDEESEGLLLLTNDGELSHRIAHPSFSVPKDYRVVVKGAVSSEALENLRRGVHLAEGKTHPIKLRVERKTRLTTTLMISLNEGKNRHLRRILAKVQLPVKRLLRVRVGPIRLTSLKRGEWRTLTRDEITALTSGHNFLPGRGTQRRGTSKQRAKGIRKPGRSGGARKARAAAAGAARGGSRKAASRISQKRS